MKRFGGTFSLDHLLYCYQMLKCLRLSRQVKASDPSAQSPWLCRSRACRLFDALRLRSHEILPSFTCSSMAEKSHAGRPGENGVGGCEWKTCTRALLPLLIGAPPPLSCEDLVSSFRIFYFSTSLSAVGRTRQLWVIPVRKG